MWELAEIITDAVDGRLVPPGNVPALVAVFERLQRELDTWDRLAACAELHCFTTRARPGPAGGIRAVSAAGLTQTFSYPTPA